MEVQLVGHFVQMLAALPVWLAGALTAGALSLIPLVGGAITITNEERTGDEYYFEIVASADGDTASANIPHGMGVIPRVDAVQILSQGLTALSGWALTTRDVTNLVFTKLASTGSGNASPQLAVTVRRPR